ncbi:MAG: ABC transporter ATP-binding protein [Coriobacteriales bacterium]|jgi:zinc transport system ATP-binding protein|nr:ABC transporter ATP-binding protein [Coriobacteriales bacterium]
MNSLIESDNAAFAYAGRTVVKGLNFCLETGDYLCIVGENGSGKTTLVDGILGLKQPCAGAIRYRPDLRRSSIGFLPQSRDLDRDFPANVSEIVLSGRLGHKGLAPFYTRADRRAAAEALMMCGIKDQKKCFFGALSGGQKQRVLLARALATAPDGLKLLILDEPMNSLDPAAKSDLYALIAELNSCRQITVIMVTHDVNTALHYANKVLMLGSEQVFFGTSAEFLQTAGARELLRDACADNCAVCGLDHRPQA